MKKILTFIAATAMTLGAMAQTTREVHGFVIDKKNGNPIPGAEVIATGGGESTMTDSDGSFRLQISPFLKTLTASYTGMQEAKMKTKFDTDMIFELKPEKKHPGFINAVWGIGGGNDGFATGGGLMGGMLGKWGFYVKTFGGFTSYGDAMFSFTVGPTTRVSKKTSLYFGLGIGSYYYEGGIAYDFGAIIRVHEHVNVNVGLSGITTFWPDQSINAEVGVGYVF